MALAKKVFQLNRVDGSTDISHYFVIGSGLPMIINPDDLPVFLTFQAPNITVHHSMHRNRIVSGEKVLVFFYGIFNQT